MAAVHVIAAYELEHDRVGPREERLVLRIELEVVLEVSFHGFGEVDNVLVSGILVAGYTAQCPLEYGVEPVQVDAADNARHGIFLRNDAHNA